MIVAAFVRAAAARAASSSAHGVSVEMRWFVFHTLSRVLSLAGN
jgi:hypothetical protein